MIRERKSELVVWDVRERRARQTCVASVVIGMAGDAVSRVGQLPVHSLRRGNLVAHIDMAIQAAGSVWTLKRGMAQLAVRLKVGV